MPSHVLRLAKAGLITPPDWLPHNIMFEAITGSQAYGCAEPGTSDMDLVGFCVPPKHMVFPHLNGHIPGFGDSPQGFKQYQQHHIEDKGSRKQYDIAMYGLVQFFNLCMDNNPNMVDVLFSPRRCITHSTEMSEHVRDHRRLFLHKGSYARFRGYAYSQLTKIKKGTSRENPRRQETIRKYGFDTKFAYHVIRLTLECEQILESGDLVLDRDREVYKSVRRGEWTIERIQEWFDQKEKHLEDLHSRSALPYKADADKLRRLLYECLEMHYGSLAQAVQERQGDDPLIDDLAQVLNKHRPGLFLRGQAALDQDQDETTDSEISSPAPS